MRSEQTLGRRDFVRAAGASVAGLMAARPGRAAEQTRHRLQVLEPISGAVMHGRLGQPVSGSSASTTGNKTVTLYDKLITEINLAIASGQGFITFIFEDC